MKKRVSARIGALVLGNFLVLSGLSMQVGAQPPADSQFLYELLNRIERLEQELRQLRGDLEIYRYRQEDQTRRIESLEQYLRAPGGQEAGALAPPPIPEPRESVSPSGPPPVVVVPPSYPGQPPVSEPPTRLPERPAGAAAPADERGAYEAAFGLLREGRYQQAIDAFQDFLYSYPSSNLGDDAQYWLGEAYYINRDFDKAKAALLAVGTNYPQSDKLPDTLLRLGFVYEELGDRGRAREVWQRLVQSYPDSQAAGVAQRRLQ